MSSGFRYVERCPRGTGQTIDFLLTTKRNKAAAREQLTTREGRRLYARRAGIEGTLSQGVRAFGLRRSRYRGLAKTHLQHVATAAAIDLGRLSDRFQATPRAATRTSRFVALAA
ncbi:MAG TPA: transposase [Microvirga sp.]|nr:transposase [Microvirga sp.]